MEKIAVYKKHMLLVSFICCEMHFLCTVDPHATKIPTHSVRKASIKGSKPFKLKNTKTDGILHNILQSIAVKPSRCIHHTHEQTHIYACMDSIKTFCIKHLNTNERTFQWHSKKSNTKTNEK